MITGADHRVKHLYEFGPFRVDPEKELLLRGDEAVPLTPKTFQVLLVLVRHSGQLVTKDDLMKMVWPDTFVEEANLSRNIFLLRKALGETAQDHQHIVTVPGRGYRFAEDVQLVPEQEIRIIAASHSKVEVQIDESKPRRWIAVGGLLLLAAAAGAFWLLLQRTPVLTAKDTLVLADFSNATGDPVFDGTLRQGMAVQLEQSPFLSMISDERIHRTLQLMGKPADASLTPAIAREICERTGSAALLDGSIASLGSQYILALRAIDCRSGDVLDEEQAQAAKKEDVLRALDKIASRFRIRVGESLATVEKHDTPLEDATTPSLPALKAYSTGMKLLGSAGESAAIPFFKQAIEIDPNFALAHAFLGLMYGSTGEPALAAASTRKAYGLRGRVSDREKFFITAYYDGRTTGDQERAERTCEAWAQQYPRDPMPHLFLSGFILPAFGNYANAAQRAQEAIQLAPEFGVGYLLLTDNYLRLDRLEDAENTLRHVAQRKLDFPNYVVDRYDLDFLKRDSAAMLRDETIAHTDPEAEDLVSHHKAFVLAYSGRLHEAVTTIANASLLAEQGSRHERAKLFETPVPIWNALVGNTRAARHAATALPLEPDDREAEYAIAFAFARIGDTARAQALADDLGKHFPEDTAVRFSYLPTVHALIELRNGHPQKAIEQLQAAVLYELGTPRSKLQGFFGALYPMYVRGEAYLAEGRGTEAAAEFQKVLDHRGIVVSDPIGALARLQFARACGLAGDKGKAKIAYHDFLALWKDADPDIPILKQARMEYTKVN
jgi:DNA-binding winged helix-turn-helix (wHTH) protein/tetratricopeptide (TPR) repeat protein